MRYSGLLSLSRFFFLGGMQFWHQQISNAIQLRLVLIRLIEYLFYCNMESQFESLEFLQVLWHKIWPSSDFFDMTHCVEIHVWLLSTTSVKRPWLFQISDFAIFASDLFCSISPRYMCEYSGFYPSAFVYSRFPPKI